MVTDLSGNFLLQIGSTGEDGLRDGNFDDATFNRPQVIMQDLYMQFEVWIFNTNIGIQ